MAPSLIGLTKEQLAQWLIEHASDFDVAWFYNKVIGHHRSIVEQIIFQSISPYPFDGLWQLKNGNTAMILKDKVIWKDGKSNAIEFEDAVTLSVVLNRKVYTAKVQEDGNLHWTDGDIWTRPNFASGNEQKTGKAAALNNTCCNAELGVDLAELGVDGRAGQVVEEAKIPHIQATEETASDIQLSSRQSAYRTGEDFELDFQGRSVDTEANQSVEEWLEEDERSLMCVRGSKNEEIVVLELNDHDLALNEVPIVQFSSPMYYCGPEFEGSLSLDIIRIGNLSERCEITVTTENGSAKAGEKYVHKISTVIFKEGSNNEELKIDLIKGKHFDTTTEFKVAIMETPAPKGCQMGRYLHTARIKVIDGNHFPSNRHSDLIDRREIGKLPFASTFWAYVKLNFANPRVRRGSIKTCLVQLVHSGFVLLSLLVRVYLVDEVLDGEKKIDKPFLHLLVVAALFVGPHAISHVLDFRACGFGVGGGSRSLLQTNLYRKFLNYSEASRSELNASELMMGMTQDVHELAHEGYGKVLRIAGSLGDLLAVLVFQIISPVITDGEYSIAGLTAVFVFPVLLGVFFHIRAKATTKSISLTHLCRDALLKRIDRTIRNYRLIADYGRRPFFEEWFVDILKKHNKAVTAANQVVKNNQYFPEWITTLSVAGWVVFGGMRVVHGLDGGDDGLTLGLFLANLSIFETIGKSWGEIYADLMDIERIYPSFVKIIDLVNLPTDVIERKGVNRCRRGKSRTLREEMQTTGTPGWPVDNLPIMLQSVVFDYGGPHNKGTHSFHMKNDMKFFQGELIALVGPQGEGKSTLLRLLGGVIFPADVDTLFVPSHLRVLHVVSEPLFFEGNLYDNLTFGCSPGDPDGAVDRVLKICSFFGIPEELLELIRQGKDGPQFTWTNLVSDSNKFLLTLARALVANPEMLCIHKPLKGLNTAASYQVQAALRTFCMEKGFATEGHRHLRRPRTCIITASNIESVPSAHHIYFVSRKLGICYVPRRQRLQPTTPSLTEAPGSADDATCHTTC